MTHHPWLLPASSKVIPSLLSHSHQETKTAGKLISSTPPGAFHTDILPRWNILSFNSHTHLAPLFRKWATNDRHSADPKKTAKSNVYPEEKNRAKIKWKLSNILFPLFFIRTMSEHQELILNIVRPMLHENHRWAGLENDSPSLHPVVFAPVAWYKHHHRNLPAWGEFLLHCYIISPNNWRAGR